MSKSKIDSESIGDEDVQLHIINEKIPVVRMEKSSIFEENASWMIQSALEATGKADGLYEYIRDAAIEAECRRLGYSTEELSVVRIKRTELKHVKAVGANGKRSVMLACVVALALEDGERLSDLWTDLRWYKMDKAFIELLRSGHKKRDALKSLPKPKDDGAAKAASRGDYDLTVRSEGLELDIVCEDIPVVGLYKESVFHEHVSWMLQQATSSTGKADGLYEFITDDEIMKECEQYLKLPAQNICIVRLKDKSVRHLKAVGTSGKRSIMLACVIALIAHGEIDVEAMLRDLRERAPGMAREFRHIVDTVFGIFKHQRQSRAQSSKRKYPFDDDDAKSRVVLKRAEKSARGKKLDRARDSSRDDD